MNAKRLSIEEKENTMYIPSYFVEFTVEDERHRVEVTQEIKERFEARYRAIEYHMARATNSKDKRDARLAKNALIAWLRKNS